MRPAETVYRSTKGSASQVATFSARSLPNVTPSPDPFIVVASVPKLQPFGSTGRLLLQHLISMLDSPPSVPRESLCEEGTSQDTVYYLWSQHAGPLGFSSYDVQLKTQAFLCDRKLQRELGR